MTPEEKAEEHIKEFFVENDVPVYDKGLHPVIENAIQIALKSQQLKHQEEIKKFQKFETDRVIKLKKQHQEEIKKIFDDFETNLFVSLSDKQRVKEGDLFMDRQRWTKLEKKWLNKE